MGRDLKVKRKPIALSRTETQLPETRPVSPINLGPPIAPLFQRPPTCIAGQSDFVALACPIKFKERCRHVVDGSSELLRRIAMLVHQIITCPLICRRDKGLVF
jgi:hypothetical protein